MICCHLFREHSGSTDYNIIVHAPLAPGNPRQGIYPTKIFLLGFKESSPRVFAIALLVITRSHLNAQVEESHPYTAG